MTETNINKLSSIAAVTAVLIFFAGVLMGAAAPTPVQRAAALGEQIGQLETQRSEIQDQEKQLDQQFEALVKQDKAAQGQIKADLKQLKAIEATKSVKVLNKGHKK